MDILNLNTLLVLVLDLCCDVNIPRQNAIVATVLLNALQLPISTYTTWRLNPQVNASHIGTTRR